MDDGIDAATAPPERTRAGWLRRTVAVVALTALVGSGVAVATRPDSSRADGEVPAVPPPASTPLPTSQPTAERSGPGFTRTGLTLTAVPRGDGTIEVVEHVRFATAVTDFTVTPPDLRAVGGRLADRLPAIVDLSVLASGRSVIERSEPVTAAEQLSTISATRSVELRYSLSGAVVRSRSGTATGRALAGLSSVVSGLPADFPVQITLPDASVRSLSCPLLPDVTGCAEALTPGVGLIRPVPADRALVQVQLDLGLAG